MLIKENTVSDLGKEARHYLRERNNTELQRRLKNLELERKRIERVGHELNSDEQAVKKALQRIEAESQLLTTENHRRNSFYSF